jgi:two-component system nitrogen regulation sensor histidine kinase NtrY
LNQIFRTPIRPVRQRSRRTGTVLLLISVLLGIIVALFSTDKSHSQEEVVRNAEQKLVTLKGDLLQKLEQISKLNGQEAYRDFFLNSTHNESGFAYYLLVAGTSKLWSDNEPAVSDSSLLSAQQGKLLRLTNGDFLAYKKQWKDTTLIGFILIRHNYDYQNKYLINNFNPALGLEHFNVSDSGISFTLPDKAGSYRVKYQADVTREQPVSLVILSSVSIVLLLLSLFLWFRYFAVTTYKHIAFTIVIFLLRTATIYFKWPSLLYDLKIFDPSFYASSFYFGSLGDLLINSALFLILSISIFENAKPYRRLRVLLVVYWIAIALAVHYIIGGLAINSRLNFELSNQADTNLYSFIAYTSIALILLSFLFITASIWRNLRAYFINGRHAWIGITLCALYAAITLSQLNAVKEHETRKLLAQKAEIRRDHVAEFLLREQEQKISNDSVVLKLVNDEVNADELTSYIVPKYLSGYLSKYEIECRALSDHGEESGNTAINFYKAQAASGQQTDSKNLYFIRNESGGASYLSIIPFENRWWQTQDFIAGPASRYLIINMTPRLFRSAKGFPELLMDGSFQDMTETDEYSVARYSSNTLVYQYGDYIYPLNGLQFLSRQNESFFDLGGFNHLVHNVGPSSSLRDGDNSFIVVSRPSESLVGILTLFSWMFIFMSVVAFIIFILSGVLGSNSEFQWNLTRKVQSSVLFLVVLIFVLVGTGTVYYIKSKYVNDQNKSISDQVNALWFLVRDNLLVTQPRALTDDQKQQLTALVSNTNIDFNLYDSEGKLMFSSQPKIYDMGIVSDRMNRSAYLRIITQGLTQFIHPERTAQLRFIAAYAPFTDRAGRIMAFLNLPYFEKQNELNRDVSVFLSAIVNIYVLLFALAVFVTIFISSRITKPLLLIQEKMSGVKLGRMNEKIEYKPKDEIGQLVHEYNRMVDELADSADKLARSERESAWREMARQVAHEIKNPLTPMKLSVQHLHRTLKEGTDKDLVDRITQTLITQIDSLSNIASAFSNFAKMPLARPEKIDIANVLMHVKDLYDEAGNIQLDAAENEYFVRADRDQLIRVFSNLLKNSLQSIQPGQEPKIAMELRREGDRIMVEIRDNGIGIPEDQKDKIFIPNFTTKSSGMGLGLAIAKNIVQEANGRIWFTSIYGTGSSFFVALPEYKGDF